MIKSKNWPKIIIPIILCLAAVVFVKYYVIGATNASKVTNYGEKIKSGNLSTDYSIEEALKDIDKFNLNAINVPIVIDADISSNSMAVNNASIEKAKKLLDILKSKNIKIILEPYPFIKNGSLSETDWKPTDIDAWFNNWHKMVLERLINEIANPYDVYALNISSNLVNMEDYEVKWCNIIDSIRSVFKGKVTYRTNWWATAQWDNTTGLEYEKKLHNMLYSRLDFISVAAYFELSDKNTNTVEELVKALFLSEIYDRKQSIYQELKGLYEKWDRPVFFGELGFPRRNMAAAHPWDESPSDIENGKEQANCFEAYRRVFEKESWIKGFSVFSIGDHKPNKHYYPSEESTKVIRKWYRNEG